MKNRTNNKSSISIKDILSRYNLVIFIIIVVVGLITAILTLNYILRLPYDTSNYPSITTGKISLDETTVTQLNKLRTSSDNSTDQTLPTGRINPFFE